MFWFHYQSVSKMAQIKTSLTSTSTDDVWLKIRILRNPSTSAHYIIRSQSTPLLFYHYWSKRHDNLLRFILSLKVRGSRIMLLYMYIFLLLFVKKLGVVVGGSFWFLYPITWWPSPLDLQNTPTASLHMGKTPPNECPDYNTKQSDVEVPVMLELWGMQRTPLLPSLPGPLWPRVVAPDRVLSIGQTKLKYLLRLNWITWNRTVLIFKLNIYAKLDC